MKRIGLCLLPVSVSAPVPAAETGTLAMLALGADRPVQGFAEERRKALGL